MKIETLLHFDWENATIEQETGANENSNLVYLEGMMP